MTEVTLKGGAAGGRKLATMPGVQTINMPVHSGNGYFAAIYDAATGKHLLDTEPVAYPDTLGLTMEWLNILEERAASDST